MTDPSSSSSVVVGGVEVEYVETGTGPVLVFVHGAYMTGAVWDDVVDRLSRHSRCIVPTWPFGAHRKQAGSADLTVPAAGPRIVEFLDALDVRDVTLVASDAGGGVVLTALGDTSPAGLRCSKRIAQLVLTNCDSYKHFPRARYAPMVWMCRLSPRLGAMALSGLVSRRGRVYFVSQLTRRGIDDTRVLAILGGLTRREIRYEAAVFTADLSPRHTLGSVGALRTWQKPVLLVWGTDDAMFPLSDAERLASTFPRVRLHAIEGGSTLVMIDQPDATAIAIAEFVTGGL